MKKQSTTRSKKSTQTAAKRGTSQQTASQPTTTQRSRAALTIVGRGNDYTGKLIKVLRRDHNARKGSKRQVGMDIILSSATTDQASKLLARRKCNNSFIAFAVKIGLVKLQDKKAA